MQAQQIIIAGDNQIGLPSQSNRQENVILRVAADHDSFDGLNWLASQQNQIENGANVGVSKVILGSDARPS